MINNKKNKWDYDSCYQLALECKKKSDMHKKNSNAYNVARKNGWFKDYTWFLSYEEIWHKKRPNRVKWSYERCKELAKKYTTNAEFAKNYPSAYTMAKRNGWMDDFDWLKRSDNIFTLRRDNVYAYLFIEQKSVYVGRTINLQERDASHRTNNRSAVFKFATQCNVTIPDMTILESNITLTEGLEKEDYYCNKYKEDGWNLLNVAKTGLKSGSLGALGSGKWNYKKCYEEAKKYTTLRDFRKCDNPTAYEKALKNGWLKDYTWLISTIHRNWTYDECYEEAKKYERRVDFHRGNGSAYDKAIKNGWIDDYLWFKESVTKLKWTYEKCYEQAKKYTTLRDFIKNSGNAYNVARNKHWLKDYTWLDKKDISQKKVAQYTLSGEFIRQYNGVREACRINGFKSNSGISQCCNGNLSQHQGFIWRYFDDFPPLTIDVEQNEKKQVGAFKDGELVMVFSSTTEAGRNGFIQSNVSACCNGKKKTHKGYEWRYI